MVAAGRAQMVQGTRADAGQFDARGGADGRLVGSAGATLEVNKWYHSLQTAAVKSAYASTRPITELTALICDKTRMNSNRSIQLQA